MPANDPRKALLRQATLDFLTDAELVDELLEALAEGESLKDLCTRMQLVYPTTLRYLIKHHSEDYEAAKVARAESALEEMAEIEGRLEGEGQKIDAFAAKETLASKRWRAERLNSSRYGQKQTLDLNVTDKTKLHLEAIRTLSRTRVVEPAALPAAAQNAALPAPAQAVDAVFVDVSKTA